MGEKKRAVMENKYEYTAYQRRNKMVGKRYCVGHFPGSVSYGDISLTQFS